MRLHPPIAILVKKCTRTFQLKHPDHAKPIEIPEGIPVLIHAYAIHRDEAYYENPSEFNPDRFKDVSDARRLNDEGKLLIFGGGPRTCLGIKFALAQIKAATCEIVHNFTLHEDPEVVNRISFCPTHFLNYPTKQVLLNFKKIQ